MRTIVVGEKLTSPGTVFAGMDFWALPTLVIVLNKKNNLNAW